MARDMDGKIIKPGEFISFKDGVETTGKVTKVNGDWVSVDYNDPITDEPKSRGVSASRCWHE